MCLWGRKREAETWIYLCSNEEVFGKREGVACVYVSVGRKNGRVAVCERACVVCGAVTRALLLDFLLLWEY